MDARNASHQSDSNARCSRCGRVFDCGGKTRPFDCWCARMPALPAAAKRAGASSAPTGRCLCPACYAEELAAAGGPGRSGSLAVPAGSTGAAGSNETREYSTD